jgi:hypothetical protein
MEAEASALQEAILQRRLVGIPLSYACQHLQLFDLRLISVRIWYEVMLGRNDCVRLSKQDN